MSSGPSPSAGGDLGEARHLISAGGGRLGTPLHIADETGSTNDDAKEGARGGAPHGSVWLAETQAAGRGRQGRTWVSPPGENLLFTVLLRIPCSPTNVPPLSLVCGLAVRDAVARAIGDDSRVLVKWPNDVVVRDRVGEGYRKLAGILIESALAGSRVEWIVVGIGVNVHTRSFSPELEATATSIARESDRPPERARVLADVLAALERDVEQVAHRGLGFVHGRLSKHDALAGRRVESEDRSLAGVGCGIDPDGRLLVRRADGTIAKVASGEMRLRSG